MPFIPHTDSDIRDMLAVIGAREIEDLFDEIPSELRAGGLTGIAPGMNEQEIARLMTTRAESGRRPLSFLGAGAYDHHIPAAVWEIATRGEFYSAYTPYQAEASQGTLQVIYEFQTMMAGLTGMDVSNASLYDGGSALAEGVLMAVRANRKSTSRRVLIPAACHPTYRSTTRTIVRNQGIELVELAYDREGGHTPVDVLAPHETHDITALVIQHPNFFGVLEDVDELTDWAHRQGALVIAVCNPTALAILRPPGEWGETGADIACGEGQPLGVPLAGGGPYFGFMCCTQGLVRQMPGRIVGRTQDRDARVGYTLTLQAREQHIRRSRATSNICTNQGLLVTAATIYMSLLGADGLARVARACHANTRALVERLTASAYVKAVFNRPCFHESVLRLSLPLADVMGPLYAHNLLPGYDLTRDYPELDNALLVCATEARSAADIETYGEHLDRIIERQTSAGCPVKPRMT
jgi:glycine dehydrogenase subunit 1